MEYSLGEIAEVTGAELDGDPDCKISRVSPLQIAEAGEISFLANKRHVRYLKNTRASVVILKKEDKSRCPVATLVCEDPYLAFALVLRHMQPQFSFTPGIHASAVVAEKNSLDPTTHVGPNAVIETGVKIGKDVYIGPGCVIGKHVTVGDNTRLLANVVLCEGVHIGDNCLLHPGVIIGADGFGIVNNEGRWLKIPQIGSVRIGDDVEIGANSTVDRGALTDTVIGVGVKLDNQVQIGHGVTIGEHSAIAGCVGIAGSTVIGKRCMIGGQSAISGHIELADDVIITGMSGVSNSIKTAGIYSSGIPVTENRKWRKNIARFRNLDDLTRRLLELEKRIDSGSAAD
jgi:UDP-3-O-[3-hydroxymyristoyl] glucosamine N-acyltransferase